jgi:hypothetical protein
LHGRGCFIAQYRHLGRDKGVFENMNIASDARLMHQTNVSGNIRSGEAKSRTTIAGMPDEKTPECSGVIR